MRYVKHILLVFLSVFMLGSVSLADSGNTSEEIGEYCFDTVNATYNNVVPDTYKAYYTYLGQYANESDDYNNLHLITWQTSPSNPWTTCFIGTCESVTSDSYTNLTGAFVAYKNGSINQSTLTNSSNTGLTNVIDHGFLSDLFNPVDWENPIYDPMIFSPKYNITNTIHNSMKTVELSYTRMSDDNYYNNNRTYYLYLKYYLYSPQDVYVDYNHYTPNSYYKSQPIVVFDYQDMHENTGYWTIDLNDYKGDSVDDFIDYCMEHVTFDFKLGMSSGKMTQRTLDYINIVERGFPFFVNNIEIWAQVFCVEDGKVYTSDWTIWNSTRLSQYVGVTPVADEQPASGIKNNENPNSEIAQNPDSDTYNPIGEQTGTDQQNGTQVVINNNTPNYPDYPTAVSYNHDNVLVQFIQTAAYLPQLFSGYSSFLTSAFAFIPSGIWTIIGMGFLSSIVIMIVKVL